MQQEAGPANDAFFDSASNDPLAGMSFFQEKAETALAHATSVFSKMQTNPHGISLLQQHHRHHRRSHSEEEDTEDSAAEDSTESGTDTSYTSDAIAFGLNTIGAGEEDMDSRVRNINRTPRA